MLAYCDYIADRIRKGLINIMNNDVMEPVKIESVSKVDWDLGPRGEFNSTKKTIYVWAHGKEYRVIVEEV